jgi:CRP-like cAMP-binding protein
LALHTGNRLLDLWPEDVTGPLLSSSQVVPLPPGREVFRQNGPMPHVYFPTTSVVGIVVGVEDGRQVEAKTVGCEGMVGLPLFLGLDFHPFRAVVQVSGEAVRVPAADFRRAAEPGGPIDQRLRRYALYRLRSASQTGACNALHTVEERMARWLLMAHDRAGKDEFTITHEYLAGALGVRRQTVSVVAKGLQRAGLVTYRRGILRVVNRQGLEAASCECYGVLRHLYERIMGVPDIPRRSRGRGPFNGG